MWFPGSRRLLYLSLLLLLLLTPLLQLHTVLAVRKFPGNAVVPNHRIMDKNKSKSKGDLLNKYFKGRIFGPNNTTSTHQNGSFDETKRRVPSCPDPLHN